MNQTPDEKWGSVGQTGQPWIMTFYFVSPLPGTRAPRDARPGGRGLRICPWSHMGSGHGVGGA